MATAEEILAAMSEEEGTEEYCTIDPTTRRITIPESLKLVGVEGDEDVTRRKFRMPWAYGEVDLSGFEIRINFRNAKGEGDIYLVEDMAKDGEEMTFSWLLSRKALRYKGDIKFIVCMPRAGDEDDGIEQEWNTTPNTFTVLEGLEVNPIPTQEEADVVAQLLSIAKEEAVKIDATLKNEGEAADAGAVGTALDEINEAMVTKNDLAKVATSGSYNDLADKPTIPAALKNPNALTFTGAVNETYDGSAAKSVDIPSAYTLPVASPSALGGVMPAAKTDDMTQEVGVDDAGGLWTMPGGGGEDLHYQLIADVTTGEEIQTLTFDTLEDGSAFKFKRIFISLVLGSVLETGYFRTKVTLSDGRTAEVNPPVISGNIAGEQLIYVQGKIATSYGYMFYDSTSASKRLGTRKVNAIHSELDSDGSNDIVSLTTWILFSKFPVGTRITVYGA